jgi:hypothetical protein
MSQFDTLPDDIRAKLKTDPRQTSGNELLPAEVALMIYERERPLWTASQMRANLDTDHSVETVRDKLKHLDEIDICESMEANNGRVYWWNDERSDWPIPPDVTVEEQGVTVAEVLTPWYAKLGVCGLAGPVIAGLFLVAGVFEIAGEIVLPVAGTDLLSIGLSAIIFSYLLLLYAGFMGLSQWITGDTIGLNNLR